MQNKTELKFNTPNFKTRIKGMLSVDFYRLFHTPLFYIFIIISAIIPAMILTMTGTGENITQPLYTNTWQIIASDTPKYIVSSIAEYANMNMVYIFGGIMLAIFIGHDYKSGYVKQLFTSHPKKQDYMISKSVIGAFSMACMCITYLLGSILAGLFVGISFSVNLWSLLCALISKVIMSIGWASLYTFINIIFRKYFGISITLSFFLGTGILIIGFGAILGNTPILNIFLYGSSVFASLSSNILTILNCMLVSLSWAVIYNVIGTHILNTCDVY